MAHIVFYVHVLNRIKEHVPANIKTSMDTGPIDQWHFVVNFSSEIIVLYGGIKVMHCSNMRKQRKWNRVKKFHPNDHKNSIEKYLFI